jgi:hypothetical protein
VIDEADTVSDPTGNASWQRPAGELAGTVQELGLATA